MLDGLWVHEEHGEVCPATWRPGTDAMTPLAGRMWLWGLQGPGDNGTVTGVTRPIAGRPAMMLVAGLELAGSRVLVLLLSGENS